MNDLFKSAALPEGEYAIVELLGHRTLIGRIAEVERFGTKMLQIEPIFRGSLLAPLLHGGSSIYCLTPCTREVAGEKGPTNTWALPASVVATLSPDMLPAPEAPPDSADDFDVDSGAFEPDDDDGGMPF